MKVYLKTFGCRANQYDSQTVRAMVERSGGTIVAQPDDADVAVFNSCAVTAEAEVDLRKSIRSAARRRPELTTLVMGCAAALDRGVLSSLPTVRHVVPGADFTALAGALDLPATAFGAATTQAGTRALLRIQDGCDEHCTFCATTLARGAHRSRHPDVLVDEATRLAARHPEIVLTGIHIGSYGSDINISLGTLVARLVTEVPAVRFRLSSIEATEIDERLRTLFGAGDRVTPHVHAPLQSGSDRVLKRMGRHWYTASRYAQAMETLIAAHEVFGFGADVIAGFPGETDEDHRATVELIASLPFTYLHVFPFSVRPGTAAERLADRLPADVVEARASELRALGGQHATKYAASRSGGVADVVVVRGDAREGLTGDYLTVAIDGVAAGRGQRLTMRLDLVEGRLVARPIGESPAQRPT